MKKQLLAFMLCCTLLPLMAQPIQYLDFEFAEKAPSIVLNDGEKKEPCVVLQEKRVIQYCFNEQKDLKRYVFRFRSVVLLEDKAIEYFNKIYLPISDERDLKLLKARSISPAGKIKVLTVNDIKHIEEEGNKYAILAVDGLEKNSIIEYYYMVEYGLRLWGTETVQGKNYVRNIDVEIWSPDNLVIKAKGYNGFPATVDSSTSESRIVIGHAQNIPVLYEESWSADDANMMRLEYKMDYNKSSGNKIWTFTMAAKNQYESIHRDEDDARKTVKNIAKELNIDSKSEVEKIGAIESYIKGNMVIMEDADVSDVAKLIKLKYGPPSVIQRLYAALFDYYNIPFEMVLTCSRFDKRFDGDFDTGIFLDKLFFYFPGSKGYFDPEDLGLRFPMIHFIYISQKAMFIKELVVGDLKSASHSIKMIEAPPANHSEDNLDLKISFNPEMDNTIIDYTRSLTGYSTLQIRPAYHYMKEDDRKKAIIEFVKDKSDESKIENISVKNADMNSPEVTKPFIVNCTYKAAHLLEAAGDNYIFKVGEVIGPQAQLYNEKPRLTPIENQFNRTYIRNIKVAIPAGYTVSGLEKLNMNISKPFEGTQGSAFVSTYKVEGNIVNIEVKEYYDALLMPVSEYEAFKQVVNAAADFNKITLVFKKK